MPRDARADVCAVDLSPSMHTSAPGAVDLSPWMNASAAGAYLRRSRRFVLREVREGRLRAARIGGRGEILTRREWCDQWVTDRAKPVVVRPRVWNVS